MHHAPLTARQRAILRLLAPGPLTTSEIRRQYKNQGGNPGDRQNDGRWEPRLQKDVYQALQRLERRGLVKRNPGCAPRSAPRSAPNADRYTGGTAWYRAQPFEPADAPAAEQLTVLNDRLLAAGVDYSPVLEIAIDRLLYLERELAGGGPRADITDGHTREAAP